MSFPILKTTAACKAHLAKVYPELPARRWKRVSKTGGGLGWSYRTFVNGDTAVIIVTDLENRLRKIKPQGIIDAEDQPLVKEIIKVARTVKHCGDYGFFYFNTITKEVYINAGDGDFSGDPEIPYSDPDEVTAKFKAIGVPNVIIEAECGPDTDDPRNAAWVDLGRHGIEIYWDYDADKYMRRRIK